MKYIFNSKFKRSLIQYLIGVFSSVATLAIHRLVEGGQCINLDSRLRGNDTSRIRNGVSRIGNDRREILGGLGVKAFTLIETLASILIISTVILGPLTVAVNAATYAAQTKDIMTATYLAQESVELLHHLQDTLYLKCTSDSSGATCPAVFDSVAGKYKDPNDLAWDMLKKDLGYNKLFPALSICFTSDGCTYDFNGITGNENSTSDTNPVKYSSIDPNCNNLKLLTSKHLYVCSGANPSLVGDETSFNRKVVVEDVDNGDGLRVTVTVSFVRTNGFTRSITLVDFLHNRK